MKRLSAILAIAVLLSVIAPAWGEPVAEAADIVVTEYADADLIEFFTPGNPHSVNGTYDNNYDNYSGLLAGTYHMEGDDVRARTALFFDVAPNEGILISAELELTYAHIGDYTAGNPLFLDIYGSVANSMGNVDGAAFPAGASGGKNHVFASLPGNNSKINIDVTNIYKTYTSNSDKQIAFVVQGAETSPASGYFTFYSNEYATADYRPKLKLTYRPNNPPTIGSFTINNGNVFTNNTSLSLQINATDSDAGDSVVEMRFTQDLGNWPSTWSPYASTATQSVSGEGSKTVYVQVKDSYGAISTYASDAITVDQTSPTGSITINSGAAWANQIQVSISALSNDAVSGVDSVQFSNVNGTWPGSWNPIGAGPWVWSLAAGDGTKTVYARFKDKAGNISTAYSDSISLDTIKPTVSGVIHGASYNTAVSPAFTDGTATLNGAAFVSGATVTVDGSYILVVTDAAGNSTTVNFTIDTQAPIVTGVTNGGLYNTTKSAVFTEGTATLNGSAYTSGTSIASEGSYTLVVTDVAGNVTTVAFEIDKTAPIISNVTNGTHYKTSVTPTYMGGTGTLNGAAYASGSAVTADGSYVLVVTDAAGNTATVSFVIDTQAPTVTGVANGGLYNTTQTAVFTEGTATLNGSAYTSGTSIAAEGSYTLVVTDAAGNVTTIAFEIDKTAPIISNVTNGTHYKTSVTPAYTGGTGTLNGAAYVSGTPVTADGSYALVVTDAVGNTATVSFVIDTQAPVVTGVANGGLYNTTQTAVFTEGTATLNGSGYTSGGSIASEGAYTLIVTDLAGNATTVLFTIDKTAPIVSNVTSGAHYKGTVTPTFSDGTATLNGNTFTSGTEISEERAHVLVVTDAAGNTTTVNFTIDNTKPVVTGVTNGGLYNATQAAVFTEGTATLNGSAYASGASIASEGAYTLVVTDSAGNATTVLFTIDKTAPIVSNVTGGTHYNVSVAPTFLDGTGTLNGAPYTSGTAITADNTYVLIVTDAAGNETTVEFVIDTLPPVVTGVADNGLYNVTKAAVFSNATAILNGSSYTSGADIVSEGSYTLVVTDLAGNVTTIGFAIDKTAPSVLNVTEGTHYKVAVSPTFSEGTGTLNGSVYVSGTAVTADGTYLLSVTDAAGNTTSVNFVIDTEAPIVTGVAEGGIYNTNKSAVFTEGTATLNSSPYTSGTSITAEGTHRLVVKDLAGNETAVNFKIDKTAPTVSGVTDRAYYKISVTPTFTDGVGKLNGSPYNSGTEITEERAHLLIVTDEAGNETTVRFVIDQTAPAVTGVEDGKAYNRSVTPVFTEGTAVLNGQSFASGTEITIDGSYTLVITDLAGNVTTLNFLIDTEAPTVAGVADGIDYKDAVTVTYSGGTALLNGQSFASGTTISAEASYILIVSDVAGNVTTVRFVIDKTAPVISGVREGETYYSTVSASFTEGTATLNGAAYTSGTGINQSGDYVLLVKDTAGNETEISFKLVITPPSTGGPIPKPEVEVIVDDQKATPPEAKTEIQDGVKTTTIQLNEKQLNQFVGGSNEDHVLEMNVLNQSDQIKVNLDEKAVELMSENGFELKIESKNGSYQLPFSPDLLEQWAASAGLEGDLEGLTLQIVIKQLDKEVAKPYQLEEKGISLAAPPVEFNVSLFSKGSQSTVKHLGTYVERWIVIPAGVDPSSISTGARFNPDHTLTPVPTRIVQAGGKQFAVLSSMTNSIYGLVTYKTTFTDIQNHWAAEQIQDMSEKLIINGVNSEHFSPDSAITRAEFAAILARALGLGSTTKSATFTDVSSSAWYYEAIQSCYSYGLIEAGTNGLFRPNASITREESMVMLARAMKWLDIKTELSDKEAQGLLDSFKDKEKLSQWALQAVALNIKHGIAKGYNGELLPKDNITRAEATVIIERLLQFSNKI
ncbi:S-layer homology domain-containing protein [Paenibacillus sp. GCM10027627]|uniref:S-layer homology domain-containing protein n=1 Tax=unclassified Paenibacillus TaxID=185978 RepID=UPI00362E9460